MLALEALFIRNYRHDEAFELCAPDTGYQVRWDFRIPIGNGRYLFIEFDGEFHYFTTRDITYEEAEEKLMRVQKLDKLKDEFSASRNFPLQWWLGTAPSGLELAGEGIFTSQGVTSYSPRNLALNLV
jgi:hypothetical protein